MIRFYHKYFDWFVVDSYSKDYTTKPAYKYKKLVSQAYCN